MKIKSVAALPLLALLAPGAGHAATAEEDAAKFGAREFVQSISMSPEGKQVVIVGPRKEGGETALVINLETAVPTPILSSSGGDQRIAGCRFVIESRVVCSLLFSDGSNRDIDRASRLVTLTPDGKDMQQLTAKDSKAYYQSNYGGGIIDYNVPDNPGSVLMLRWVAPQAQTGSIGGRTAEGLAVERVDLTTLSRKIVESPRVTAVDYVSDGHGNVRLMQLQSTDNSGYARSATNYMYRTPEGSWKPLSKVETKGGLSAGFEPVAVDSAANVVYGFDAANGFTGLYKMSMDGTGNVSLVLGKDGADVDELIQIGRNQRVVGASYAVEKRQVEYFDPELKQLSAALAKALGGNMQVDIIDSTADEGKLLILAGSDTQSGKLYIYDKATRQLGFLIDVRPELEGAKMGTMKHVTYPAADGSQIPGYLTLPPGSDGKNLPAIVMPHGGPWARDEWGFDWLVQYFVARGYAVLQPNYRGSTGYGAQWFQKNGFQSWATAIGDVNDAGRWLQAQGIAAPGKLGIVGWSYGGYAALQSQVVDPDLFKAVVAIAPVTDLDVWRNEMLNYSNFRIMDEAIGKGPHIETGSPARHADRFKAPVLLVHGDTDTNVRVQESRLMEGRLKSAGKQVEYIEFKGLAHQLDDAGARAKMLTAAERTLRKGMGLD